MILLTPELRDRLLSNGHQRDVDHMPVVKLFRLLELASVRLPFGLGIERDLYFEGTFALSVYAEAARMAGRIVLDLRRLQDAVTALRGGG
jgi:hypothetical protein